MTIREMSLLDQVFYMYDTFLSSPILPNSSNLFGFTDDHDGSKIYNINLGVYNFAMSNSMLFYRNDEKYWSLPFDDNIREILFSHMFKYRTQSLSRDAPPDGYYYKDAAYEWSVIHKPLPFDDNIREILLSHMFKYRTQSLSRDAAFHEYDYKDTAHEWSVIHKEPSDIPKDDLFNYSVAARTINKTIYPTHSPLSSGGIYGIIQ